MLEFIGKVAKEKFSRLLYFLQIYHIQDNLLQQYRIFQHKKCELDTNAVNKHIDLLNFWDLIHAQLKSEAVLVLQQSESRYFRIC